MDWQRSIKLTAICASAFALQGCVAAAIPLVASGVMVGEGGKTSKDKQSEATTPVADTAVAAETQIAPELVHTAEEATAPSEVSTEQSVNPASDQASGTLRVERTAPTAPVRQQETISGTGATLFDPLFDYASQPEMLQNGPRKSAMLANATELEPDRNICQSGAPTVLIDLDPKDAELLPIDAGSASPALAQKLVQLRNRGVSIAWISQERLENESLIRAALFRSGLDQLGSDRILLINADDQRKQQLREHLASVGCLIAIAGDDRSDFHELFDYLLDPSDAIALEPLIGDGWFLIPTPLISERSR